MNGILISLPDFNEGINQYINQAFHEAHAAFEKVVHLHEDDRTARFFFTHTQQLLEGGVGKNKRGVVEMQEK